MPIKYHKNAFLFQLPPNPAILIFGGMLIKICI